jgi:Tfp pilus assembly protein PilF
VVVEAPHSSFTDHWIRVVEEEPLAPPPAAPGPVELVPYFEADAEEGEGRIYEGMAYVIYGRQQGDSLALEKGIDLLAAALADDPAHGEAQFLLGFARLQVGRVREAIPALEEAVRQDPNVPERLNALAQAYEADRRDAAYIERLYTRALQLQPAVADVRVNYGRFLEAQGRLEAALGQYRQAAEEQPWLAAAHYNLGTAYLKTGALEPAEAALRRALELEPDHPEALGNLGLLFASQGRTEAAGTLFRRAAEAHPAHPVALANLGAFYLNEGRLPEAIDLLRRAAQLRPAYVDALVNLALAYYRSGNPGLARQYARQALDADPSNPRARQLLASVE